MNKIMIFYRKYRFQINLFFLPFMLLLSFFYNYGVKNNWQLIDFIFGNINIDSPYYDSFLTIIQICIAWIVCIVAVVFNAKQIEIQKNNIKLQMFEKRYKVFQTIVEAKTLINRDDYILNGITQNGYFESFESRITDSFENLRQQTILSLALYDDSIFQKMGGIQERYQKAIIEYRLLPIKVAKSKSKIVKKQISEIQKILISYANDPTKMNKELDYLLPGFSDSFIHWSETVGAFNDYINSCGIMKDFDEYLKVENLDK